MTPPHLKNAIDRIRAAYPVFINLLSGSANLMEEYGGIEGMTRRYMQSVPENWGHALLEQTERAQRDESFRTMMKDPATSIKLTESYGGIVLFEEDFEAIKSTVKECLEKGEFLSEHERQRRRFLRPKHLAEFQTILDEIEAGDEEKP